MKIQIFCLGIALTALAACQNLPNPNAAVTSKLELRMGGSTLGTQAAAYQTETGLTFTPEAVALVCDDTQSGYRYLQRRFVVTNNTGNTLTNLQIHAYNKSGNTDSTALKSITSFGGAASPDATQALPRHGIGATCSTAPYVPSADYADLQLYSDTETTNRTGLVSLAAGEYLLSYGYLVRQRATQTNIDNNDRTLASGESGFVTVALRVPVGTDSSYNFSMTFLTFTDNSVNELVQSPEDQFAGTTAGLFSLPSGVSRVTVLGGARCGLSGTNRFQTRVITGKNANLTISELSTQNLPISTTVSSSADSGAGSLREAIANAASGATLCFTQDITLASELTLNKNLNIFAGENVALSGNNASRVFNIGAFTVRFYGFTVKEGQNNSGGGGIRNAGTLGLFGMKVQNNTATGSTAQGGGIYSSGVVSSRYSKISNNTATGTSGTVGSPGTVGGSAQGGGMYLATGGSLTLIASTVNNNTAQGGMGGQGMAGMSMFIAGPPPPAPPLFICTIPPGNGGNGGAATGGGVYRTGGSIAGSGLVSGNTVTAGSGGAAGSSPSPCSSANAGSTGSASNPDFN